MTQRLIALGAALTFAASSIAQAAPLASSSATGAKTSGGQVSAAAWVDPPAKLAAKQPVAAPLTLPEPAEPAKVAATEPSAPAQVREPSKTVATQLPAAVAPKPARIAAVRVPVADRVAPRTHNERRVRYAGGEGGAWKMGRNAYGFSGSFGSCRFTGFAGPNGYRFDRVC